MRFAAPMLCAALAAGPAAAVQKCTLPDGRVVYQDAACTAGATAQAVRTAPNVMKSGDGDRPAHVTSAIATGRPTIGMTLRELERAMGRPDKINTGQYGARSHDQLIYYTDDRTIYVYVTNGVVTSIQNTDGGRRPHMPMAAHQQRPCPGYHEIREIEVEISKLENRERPQVLAELQRRLSEAKACRR